jgi:hypothetical protein
LQALFPSSTFLSLLSSLVPAGSRAGPPKFGTKDAEFGQTESEFDTKGSHIRKETAMPHRAIFAAVPVAAFFIFAAAQFVRADNTHSGRVVSVTVGTGGADG